MKKKQLTYPFSLTAHRHLSCDQHSKKNISASGHSNIKLVTGCYTFHYKQEPELWVTEKRRCILGLVFIRPLLAERDLSRA